MNGCKKIDYYTADQVVNEGKFLKAAAAAININAELS